MANERKSKNTLKRIDKKNERIRQKYSPSKLKLALHKIKDGESASKISKEFNIPRTTLIYKSNGKRPELAKRPGPEPMLGIHGEEELTDWIQTISKRGFPLTKEALCYSASQLLKSGHGNMINTYDDKKGPGRRWFSAFMKRHQKLAIRSAEYLHRGRAATNETSIRKWFEDISRDLKDHMDIFNDRSRIFNCDETSVFLHPKSRPVIANRGQRNVYDAGGRCNKENLTIGNLYGKFLKPSDLKRTQWICL